MAKSKGSAKARKSGANRSLNAFAIAAQELNEKPTGRVRRAMESESESGSDDESGSEGSEDDWAAAHVDSDSDSEIDSDDAFGESDEERYEDFAFRGSSSNRKKKRKSAGKDGDDVDLSEDESEEEDEEEDGEGYMDLSEMLDRKTPDSEEESERESASQKRKAKRKRSGDSDDEDGQLLLDASDESDSGSEDSDESDDDEMDISDDEDAEEEDPLKLQALESLITSLPTGDRPAKRARVDDANEKKTPGEYNLALTSDSMKVSIQDLLPSVTDPKLKKSLKLLADDDKGRDRKGGVPGKLSAPLAKRQQDRIDRAAAYGEAKETLDRWVDTVKHNREADRLQFPLANASNAPIPQPKKLIPINPSEEKHLNDFEATISGILKQSNMASEKQIQEFEELKTNNMSVEEVQQRTTELRMARELMFREEAKAKRLKKIKSKTYRRIKKRERMREEEAIEAALNEERGGELDPEEEERRARKRAEERMSLRHKQSRWAKGVKDSGRTAWDLDARDAAIEMAQRHEDLRKRISGKTVNSDGESEESSDSDDDDAFDEEAEKRRLLKELEELDEAEKRASGNKSKLMNMKFMQTAEAAKKKENESLMEDLRRDLEAGDNSGDDGEDDHEDDLDDTGRMSFKPGKKETPPQKKKKQDRLEFEAPPASDDSDAEDAADGNDDDDDVVITTTSTSAPKPSRKPLSAPKTTISSSGAKHQTFDASAATAESNPWLANTDTNIARPKSKALKLGKQDSKSAKANHKIAKDRKAAQSGGDDGDDGDAANVVIDTNVTLPLPVRANPDAEAVDLEGEINLIPANAKDRESQRELIKKAFAGDDVVREFAREKQRVMDEDDDQVIDETLPGWGHWSGAGLTKSQKKFNAKRKKFTKVVEGIKKDKRKDAKLEKVIINERLDKKTAKFQTASVPHPFESKAQYERSLRLPVGPEWTTKSTFQDVTAPRVLVKQGRVIEAISAPLK